MKRTILCAVLMCVLLPTAAALATVPRTIGYQGVLTDDAGVAVIDGSYSMTFRLYNVPAGGSAQWEETQSVEVYKGIFNVVLGVVTPLSLYFNNQLYLGIAVDGEPELSPRIALAAAPYSLQADYANYLGAGYQVSNFSLAGHDHDDRYYTETELNGAGTINDLSNPVDWTKLKNVPSGFADGSDDVGGSGDGHSLDAADGTPVDAVYVDNDGNVGIGTTSPTEKLHLSTPSVRVYMGKTTEALRCEHIMSGAYGSLGLQNIGVSGYSSDHYAVLGSTNTGYGIYGSASGTEGRGVYGFHVSGSYGVLGADNDAVFGKYGGNNNNGALGGSYFGVRGESASGYAGYFLGKLFTSAFEMPYGAAAGRVLTSDASGNGTWQDPPSGIGGSGTANRVPLFTAATTLGNSVIRQSSNNIGIGQDNPVSKLEVNGMCRVVGVAWPPSGKGLELAYNGSLHRGYIQVYDRDAESWGELCLGLGRVGIGDCAPEAMLDVQNNTEGLSVQMAENDMALRAENEPDTSKVYLCYSKYGVWSESNLTAVYADNPAHNFTAFLATDDYAVRGYNGDGPVSAYLANGDKGVDAYNSSSGNGAELATDNYAGYFDGPVHVQGTLSKSAGMFKIDHPLDPQNKYLSHSFVESPDMMNVYNGNVTLGSAGEAWVELPEWFEALNRDFRYQLTCIGGYAPVYVAEEIAGNRFRIAGGAPGLKVSWMVTGVRRDPYAELHRIPVEQDKPPEERGRYMHPEVYGRPESQAIHQRSDDPPDP